MTTEEAVVCLECMAIDMTGGIAGLSDMSPMKDLLERRIEAINLAQDALRAQQERENPKPLTLDELREMDLGSPPIWDRNLNEWCAVRRSVNGFAVIVYIGGGSRPLEANRFYRNKPKEGSK